MKRQAEDELEDDARLSKKRAHSFPNPIESFRKGLFEPEYVKEYRKNYAESTP